MKKIAKVSLMLMLLFTPALMKSNEVKAEGPAEVIADIADAIHDLFCPATPRQVCKPAGESKKCMDGACISFRKSCSKDSDCQ